MPDLSAQTRDICRLLEIKPARTKGQNFLINDKIYDEIVRAADLKPEDTVLEIGPGLGFLTVKLAHLAKQVIAVELDDKLANYLQMGIDARGLENVTIINEDILKFEVAGSGLAGKKYKIVANLPYNITSFFLRRFLNMENGPASLVLMLQKEVASRITAVPPDMSLLAVSVQHYAAARIIREVKAGNFWPEPEVDSAIIRLDLTPKIYSPVEDKKFFQMLRIGFSAKRKMLKNNLAAGFRTSPAAMGELLTDQGFNAKLRAEDLSLSDWHKLFAALSSFVV